MLAFGRPTVPERGVTRFTWFTLEFYTPSGMVEDKIVKFCARVGPRSVSLVVNQVGVVKVMWRLNFFRKITVIISKTVQHTYNGRNRIWPIKWQQRQWLWRSLTGCKPFQMQSVEHLCNILRDFNWQCARVSWASCVNWERRIVYARKTESG